MRVCLNVSLPRTSPGPLMCRESSRVAPCHSLPLLPVLPVSHTMSQHTASPGNHFRWALRWAMATFCRVGRSKKYWWCRSHSRECSVGLLPAVPSVTHTSLLWTLHYSSHYSISAFHWTEVAVASFHASFLYACSTDLPSEGEAWCCNRFSLAPHSCMPGLGSWR